MRTTRGPGSAWALAAALLLAALLAVGASRPAHAARLADGPGAIIGAVNNGSASDAPVAGLRVTLQQTNQQSTLDLTSVTTNRQGHFSFTEVPLAVGDQYAVYAHFQGGLYSTPPITVTSGATAVASLTVYDATSDASALSVKLVTVLVRQPRPLYGLVGIGEFVTVANSGSRAFVGTVDAATGMPAVLRFALPTGATNLTPGIGFVGSQVIQVAGGFGATATVPPGTTQFAFAYDLPYDGTSAIYEYTAEYPTAQVALLVPPTMRVTPRDYAGQSTVEAFGATYLVFDSRTLAPNQTAALTLGGLPAAGERSDLSFRALLALAALLALLVAVLAGLYLRRGDLAALLPRRHAPTPAPRSAQAASPLARSTEHERLLRALLTVERARRTGELTPAQADEREEELRAALRAELAAELAEGGERAATAGRVGAAPDGAGPMDAVPVPRGPEATSGTPSGTGSGTGSGTACGTTSGQTRGGV